MDEIAECRGRKTRDGSAGKLYNDLLRDIKLIANLRLTMVWETDKGKLTFGKDLPEALLHITDWEYEKWGQIRKAFTFRAGEPLKSFLDKDRGRLVGYCSRGLLKLDPYRDKLAKKIGVYWTLQAVAGAARASFAKAKIRTILDFCGESLNPKRPGAAVDQVIAAFKKLKGINLIPDIPLSLTPKDKSRGYFGRWLEQVVTVEVNPALCLLKGEGIGQADDKPGGGSVLLELQELPRY
jgi:hypothetical protein